MACQQYQNRRKGIVPYGGHHHHCFHQPRQAWLWKPSCQYLKQNPLFVFVFLTFDWNKETPTGSVHSHDSLADLWSLHVRCFQSLAFTEKVWQTQSLSLDYHFKTAIIIIIKCYGASPIYSHTPCHGVPCGAPWISLGRVVPLKPLYTSFNLSLLVNIWSRTPDIMSCHQHHNFWLLLIRVGLIKKKCVPASKFDIFILDPHCFIITEVALGSVDNTWRCFCSHIIYIIYLEFFIQTADRLCQTTGYIQKEKKKHDAFNEVFWRVEILPTIGNTQPCVRLGTMFLLFALYSQRQIIEYTLKQ